MKKLAILCLMLVAFFSVDAKNVSTSARLQIQEIQSLKQQLQLDKFKHQLLLTKQQKIDREKLNPPSRMSAQTNLALAQADRSSIVQTYDQLLREINFTSNAIKSVTNQLQNVRVEQSDPNKRERIKDQLSFTLDHLSTALALQKQRLEELEACKLLSSSIVMQLTNIASQTEMDYQRKSDQARSKALQNLLLTTQMQRQHWMDKQRSIVSNLARLEHQKDFSEISHVHQEILLFEAQEMIGFLDMDMQIAQLNDKTHDLERLHLSEQSQHLNQGIKQAKSILDSINFLLSRITSRKSLVQEHADILTNVHKGSDVSNIGYQVDLSILNSIRNQYKQREETLQILSDKTHIQEDEMDKQITQVIAKRQGLPLLEWSSWVALADQVSFLPRALVTNLTKLVAQFELALAQTSIIPLLLIHSILMMLAYLGLRLRVSLDSVLGTVRYRRSNTTSNIIYVGLSILDQNYFSILIALLFFAYANGLDIPASNYYLTLCLLVIWFCYRAITGVARIILAETLTVESETDWDFYHRLNVTFSLGALITALTVMTNQLHISAEVADLFNRFYMLILLGLSGVLFKARNLLPQLIENSLQQKKPYVLLATRLLCMFIPFGLFTNAMIGLMGYIDLAWNMAFYQLALLMVVLYYVIVKGVLLDFIDLLSDLAIRYLEHGFILSEAFLNPVIMLVRLGVFFSSMALLFWFYGWDSHSFVVMQLMHVLYYPLFESFAFSVKLINIIVFIVLVSVIYWIAKWSREFSYRWFFSHVSDLGLRNTFSVFTQYLLVSVFALASLRSLGIDFTALSYILGGLAFGLGFGLRDLASNLINGMVILMERPVRVGDLISIGTYEGEVTSIGLRAMTLRSWDHMEVMIPNSEPFNHAFINWTHQDSVVRTVFPVKVHRMDDPVRVRDIILEVLQTMDSVMKDPEPEVLMKQIEDSLIEFEVRYFMNLQLNTRVRVRSEVMFAIWERFKNEGIRPPYPQQEVTLRQES